MALSGGGCGAKRAPTPLLLLLLLPLMLLDGAMGGRLLTLEVLTPAAGVPVLLMLLFGGEGYLEYPLLRLPVSAASGSAMTGPPEREAARLCSGAAEEAA